MWRPYLGELRLPKRPTLSAPRLPQAYLELLHDLGYMCQLLRGDVAGRWAVGGVILEDAFPAFLTAIGDNLVDLLCLKGAS